MKLHGSYTSPFVRHCRIALAQTGLAHEFVETDYSQSAQLSPTARVPFLQDGDRRLSDSASILRHIREQAGQAFCADLMDFDFYLLVDTALDTAVNLFLLERDGITPDNSAYLQRQQARVKACMDELELRTAGHPQRARPEKSDGLLRLGCFLAWGLFRQRIRLDGYPALTELLQDLEPLAEFADTRPTEPG